MLARAAAVQPLVVVLDDVHAADHGSLLLLRFVARQLQALPILVLATSQDDVRRSVATEQIVGDLAREGRSIRLTGILRDDVERLIRETTGVAPPARLVREITEVTHGNPFFIDEIVRLLAGTERLVGRGRRPLADLRVPGPRCAGRRAVRSDAPGRRR